MSSQQVLPKRQILSYVLILMLLFSSLPFQAGPASASASGLVISQVYGGGGNTGAPLTHDFIEIFNGGSASISLAGLSLQYASATGTGNFGANSAQLTELPAVSLDPGQYYLVQQAAGAGNGVPLPNPDLIDLTPIAMAAGAGKVVLVEGQTSLGCNGGSTPCSAEQLARIIDLVGYGGANFFEGTGPAPTLSNTTAALRNDNGCTDTDNNSADFSAGAPAPRNTASPLNPCGVVVDTAPSVTAVSPVDGAANVQPSDPLSVTFSEPVDVFGDWFSITCSLSGAKTASVSGGPTLFTLDPDTDFAYGESCTATIFASQVSDQDTDDPPDNMLADFSWSFSIIDPDVCDLPYTPIYTIQGSGTVTPFMDQVVTTEGVVTGDFQGSPGLNGFFIQDPVGDGDPLTSDGIFIFVPSASPFYNVDVQVGDQVRLTGRATEFNTLTEIDFVTALTICGSISPLEPTPISLPETFDGELERYEGMFVTFENSFTVSQNFFQGRYGQVTLSSGDRLYNHTNQFLPGSSEAQALADENARRLLVLDDGNSAQNPNPIPYIGQDNTLRAGDFVSAGLTGLLDAGQINANFPPSTDFRLHPTTPPEFTRINERTAAPDPVGGNLKVASFNVLNYFTTLDVPGAQCFPNMTRSDCRGADSPAEFERQRNKIIAALVAIDADVVGLMEIENNGATAVADLVDGLNAATAPGTYAYVSEPAPGGDAIKVAMIYKPASVTPLGPALNYQVNTPEYGPLYDRPPLAQTFQHNLTSSVFSVMVNHFKSKGSCPVSGPDIEQGDGQGCWNAKRTLQAQGLFGFIEQLASDTGDPDVLIIGDLNSYGLEDPITILTGAGLVDELRRFVENPYTYVFDGLAGYLDHAISTPGLSSQVTGAATWAINTDEPSVIDYNTEFKPQDLYAPTPYRSSDHDPVIVGLQLSYDFEGFFPPVKNLPDFNIVKAGLAVPVKFSLNGDYGLSIFAAGYPKSELIACDASNPAYGVDETVSAGRSSLSYDPATGQYTYLWKTEKAWQNTCRQLVIQLNDGSFHRANFMFVK